MEAEWREEEESFVKIFTSRAAKIAASTVSKKLSYLLTEKPELLLGLKYEFRRWDLHEMGNEHISNQKREILCDLEDVIDELLIRSVKIENRCAFIQRLSAMVDLPKELFYVLAIVDLIHNYKLWKLLEHVIIQKNLIPYKLKLKMLLSLVWQRQSTSSLFNLNLGSSIISPVKTKLEALTFQKQLRPSLRKQARWLSYELTCLEESLQDVESTRQSEEELAWVDELCDVCRSAENVASLFIDQQQLMQMKNVIIRPFSMVWSPKSFASQHKLARQMSWIKDKICTISSSRCTISSSRSTRRLISPNVSSQHPSQQPPCIPEQLDIVSFEEDVDAITAMLLKDDLRRLTISIVGVGGIGKTSLAKLIFENKAIADHFPHRIWVTENNLRKIRFFVYKKCLIIMDDCCSREFRIISSLRDIPNGTRIIFIFRGLHEALGMSDVIDFTYRLHLRSNEESWALFTHTLKMKIPPELQENMKKDILSKCGGLPKVIVKLGEQLSQATLEEWPTVLEQFIQDEEPWSEVLQGIDEYLSYYQRRCLFHLGLFPKGYKIPARRLIALWVAEGLRGGPGDERSPECIAELCLREFVNFNMVQVIEAKCNDKIKICSLPEALRLHWFSKAKETNARLGMAGYLTYHPYQHNPIFDYIHGNNRASPYSRNTDIISFSSFDTREENKAGEEIGNSLDRCISSNCFRFLWILDLERMYKPKLPKAVDQLIQLRYLGLRWTYLDVLSISICKLLNLQTLDLKGTCITMLPCSIWMMQNLRNLLLDEKSCSVFVPRQDNIFLKELQTLRGVCIDEDSPVRNGLDTSLNIRKLGLKCRISVPSRKDAMSSQLIDVAYWVRNLKHLQYLKLKSFDENGQPWDLNLESLSAHADLSSLYLVGKLKNQHLMSELPDSLIELTLSASGLAEDPMQKLARFPNLRILRLFSRSFTGKKMLCSSGGFRKLEVLKFWELELLEEWNVEEAALPCLTELEIRRCRNLKMIPDGLRNIRTLREVILTGVPILSSRVKENLGEDWNKIAHVRHVYAADNDEHKSN